MLDSDALLEWRIQDKSRRILVNPLISLEMTQMSVHFVHRDGRVERQERSNPGNQPRQDTHGLLVWQAHFQIPVRRTFHSDETTTRPLFRQLTSRSTSKNGY
jgi:hypothetical protein